MNIFDEIKKGSLDGVKRFLDNKVDPNVLDKNGLPALFAAISTGNMEICKLLVERGADVNLKDLTNEKPLNVAICNKNFEIAKFLVEKGANVDEFDLSSAAYEGNVDICKLLLDKGGNSSSTENLNALYVAASEGHLEVCKLFTGRGINVNEFTSQGELPFVVAAKTGNLEICKLLLQNGANINQKDKSPLQTNPLVAAAKNGNLEVCRFLIDNRANVNQPDAEGKTPLMYALKNRETETVKYLLEKGADTTLLDNAGYKTKDFARDPESLAILNKHRERERERNKRIVNNKAQTHEFNKKYATKIENIKGDLNEVVDFLIESREHGKNVYCVFNGTKLYSADVTLDSAYLAVMGEPYTKFRKTMLNTLLKDYQSNKVAAKEKIPFWKEEGRRYIPQYLWMEWGRTVDSKAKGVYNGLDIQFALNIFQAIYEGKVSSKQDVEDILDEQEHSPRSRKAVKRILMKYSERYNKLPDGEKRKFKILNERDRRKL